MIKKRHIYIVALALLFAVGGTAQAQNTWTGASSDSYNDAGNWSKGTVPDTDSTINPSVLVNDPSITAVINYTAAESNTVRSTVWSGGMTFNQTGGWYNSTLAGNTIRDWVGNSSMPLTTLNIYGGLYQSSHQLNIGIGGDGLVNLAGGELLASRGGNGYFGNGNGMSLSIGSANGTLIVSNSILRTRGPVELGTFGTVSIQGAGSTISIGTNGGTGTGSWYQNSNSVLRIGIGAAGVSPIHIANDNTNNMPVVMFKSGAQLDIGFIDGYSPASGSWPVIIATNATWSNLGMVPAAGVDTNDWGFSISGDVMYIGYKLGWPFGASVAPPPASQRTLYWTGAGGDTDSNNSTNWVTDTTGTTTDWGPYNDDLWRIADISVSQVVLGTDYVVDYNGTAPYIGQRDLEIGIGAQGTLNYNSGDLTFTSYTSSRQEIGLNANGNGTLNMNNGSLTLNAARFGGDSGKGTLNLNGGTFTVSRAYGDYCLWLGWNSGTGSVNVVGGRMFTRGAVQLGQAGGAIGNFYVEGSAATDIGIGSSGSSIDGAWFQNSGSTLKARIDAGGITPIRIIDKGDTNSVYNGDVYFKPGSILDIGWMPGVTNYNTFDIMTWQGNLVEGNLALAASVNTNVWSFEYVDTNSDGTNDTLRATAYGETANGTPYGWLLGYGLDAADDGVDVDGDGLLTWQEYVAGTNPTNSASVLAITSGESIGGSNFVVTWQSVAGKSYNVMTNLDLVFGTPGVAASGIVGQPVETSYTSSVPAASSAFFKIGVE